MKAGTVSKPLNTPSIKDALNTLKTPRQETDSTANDDFNELTNEPDEGMENEIDNLDTDDTVSDDLVRFWERFTDSIRNDEPRMFPVLRNQELILKDNEIIQLQFRNNTQIEDFKRRIKASLLSGLRKNLGKPSLEIEEIIYEDDDPTPSKHLTDKDKLRHMIEKNPLLKKLYQDFHLDFE
jgi:hypothetical protein